MHELLEADGGMVAWWGTPAECWSALARLRREEVITLRGESEAHALLEILRAGWLEVLPSEAVREMSRRILRTHPLRAADALQLAAALIWVDGSVGEELVTFHQRLGRAAELEGLRVVTG